jgi:cell division protein FtsI/penicillin-binding protein 2
MNSQKIRRFIFILCFIFLLIGVAGRLIFLMVLKHDFYLKRSEKQIQKLIKIDTSRGKILDRNLYPLALSRPVYSIYASPVNIPNKSEFSDKVAPLIGLSKNEILEKINQPSTFVWLKRKVDTANIQVISRLFPNQLNVLNEERRVYPNRELLSDVLGFVGMDKGLGGIEYKFDRFLTGEQGFYIIKGDPRGVRIISSNKTLIGRAKGFELGENGMQGSSLRGGNLVMTIDYRVQFLVEKLLMHHVKRVGGVSGQVIVMDVKTGDIMAMANYPYFDPNNFQHVSQSILKNSCVVDVFEPGSIFKLVTYAAALEEGIVTPGMIIEIPETMVIQRRQIKEARPRDPDAPTHYKAQDILIKSMNVGTSMLAEKMGAAVFLNYIQWFGFGQKTSVLLPGETSGLVRSVENTSPIDLAVMSFGQGISVTGLQMVAAAAVIGNQGIYVRPRIVKHQTDHNNLTLSSTGRNTQHRIISRETAALVREAMEAVVTQGSGRYAKVNGHRVGGKTGTAQKPMMNGGGYQDGAYVASFLGLLPITSPQFAILALIDEPETTIWGSTAAGPLFSDVAKVMIDYYDVPPD